LVDVGITVNELYGSNKTKAGILAQTTTAKNKALKIRYSLIKH
jgi:hypothetical protein